MIHSYSYHEPGHVSKVCPNWKESTNSKRSFSRSKKRLKHYESSDKSKDANKSTEHANLAATVREDFERFRAPSQFEISLLW